MVNAYYPILGLAFIVWVGILTFISLIPTIATAVMNRRGIHFIPFPWHPRLAILTLVLASFHAFLAIGQYL
jgi:heme exporter protein D